MDVISEEMVEEISGEVGGFPESRGRKEMRRWVKGSLIS
jgi:hypothetical protein